MVPWPWLAILALLVVKASVARLAMRLPARLAVRWSICEQVSDRNVQVDYLLQQLKQQPVSILETAMANHQQLSSRFYAPSHKCIKHKILSII